MTSTAITASPSLNFRRDFCFWKKKKKAGGKKEYQKRKKNKTKTIVSAVECKTVKSNIHTTRKISSISTASVTIPKRKHSPCRCFHERFIKRHDCLRGSQRKWFTGMEFRALCRISEACCMGAKRERARARAGRVSRFSSRVSFTCEPRLPAVPTWQRRTRSETNWSTKCNTSPTRITSTICTTSTVYTASTKSSSSTNVTHLCTKCITTSTTCTDM